MAMRYAELHCRTNFSFLEGASYPDELVNRAHTAAKETGLKLLIGAEITPQDGPPILLYATNRAAWRMEGFHGLLLSGGGARRRASAG